MTITKEQLKHDEEIRQKISQADIVLKQLKGLCGEEEFFQASKQLETDLQQMRAGLAIPEPDLESFFDSLCDAVAAAYCRLHYIHGLSWTELGAFTGKSRQAIQIRCNRALRKAGI